MPLYVTSGGQLSTDLSTVEKRLKKIFELSKPWKTIVLLDEADVIMSKRPLKELERNAIVAGSDAAFFSSLRLAFVLLRIVNCFPHLVWLRMIEYFEGILFLTTNRHGDLDEAFQSRINFTIALSDLGFEERQRI